MTRLCWDVTASPVNLQEQERGQKPNPSKSEKGQAREPGRRTGGGGLGLDRRRLQGNQSASSNRRVSQEWGAHRNQTVVVESYEDLNVPASGDGRRRYTVKKDQQIGPCSVPSKGKNKKKVATRSRTGACLKWLLRAQIRTSKKQNSK